MKKILILTFVFFGFVAFSQHRHVTPIDSVQFVMKTDLENNLDAPSYFKTNDTVTLEGIVTFNPWLYAKDAGQARRATWIQDTTLKQWGGVMMMMDVSSIGYSGTLSDLNNATKFYENCVPGYKVKITCRLGDYNGGTQMYVLPVEIEIVDIPSVIDSTHIIDPALISIGDLMKNDGAGGQDQQYVTGEPYEGMFVRFEDVTVVDVVDNGGSRKRWYIQDEFGNKIQIDDNSGYYRNDNYCDAPWIDDYTYDFPTIGTRLDYIQGVIGHHSQYGYSINPLIPTDVKIAAAAPYISKVNKYPSMPTSSDKVVVKASITDNDGNITGASLFYSVGIDNKNFTEVFMSDIGGNVYRGTIPAMSNGDIVNYFIKAVDNSNTISYAPDSLATGSVYQVTDGGITSISQIQNTPFSSGSSLWVNDTIDVDIYAVITSSPSQFYGGVMSIQDDVLPYSGIFMISNGTNGLVDLKVGDSIRLKKAFVEENYGVTQLQIASRNDYELLNINNQVPAPLTLTYVDSIAKKIYNYSEPYEGMFVRFDTVFVTHLNPDEAIDNYGEWLIGYDTVNGGGLRVDDLSDKINRGDNLDTFYLNQRLEYIQGILYYSFSNYKLIPRDYNDIAGYSSIYQPIPDFEADIVSGKVPLEVKFSDRSANTPIQTTYDWTFPGTEEASSIERYPKVTYKNPGAFDATLKVMNATAEDSITKVQYIVVTGVEELGENVKAILLYPNPVSDILNVKGETDKPVNLQINLYNNAGQKVMSGVENVTGHFNLMINTQGVETGIYYLEIISDGSHSFTRTLIKK